MTSHRILRPGAIALLLILLTAGTATAQFNCFPSCAEDDGRLLAIAGNGLITLSDTVLELELSVPAGTASFELGIFDGDGGVKVGGQNRWDTGDFASYAYTLFADPLADGAGTTVVPLDPDFPTVITGSQMLNDDWCCSDVPVVGPSAPGNFVISTGPAAQAPSGNYFYRLRIELTDPAAFNHLNGFKIRTSGIVTIEASEQPISYVANFGGFADAYILFPDLDQQSIPPSNRADPAVRATSTYDGRFSFFFEVDKVDSTLTVWGGDFDYGKFDGSRGACELPPNSGSGIFNQSCLAASEQDTDDADTPDFFADSQDPDVPAFAAGTDAVKEGVALGEFGTTGAPRDDYDPAASGGFGNLRVRSPSVRWDLVAPDGQAYANNNASGNQEWERFTLSTAAYDPTLMDYSVLSIPLGTYEMRIEGVDMQNLNAILLPFRALCVDVFGAACEALKPYLVGDTVFRDDDGDGIQDEGEPGIGGVIVNLLDGDGNVLDSTVTDANGEYSFEVESAGTDANGDPIPVEYQVEVAPENFAGPASTGGEVGDLVWIDDNRDGVQNDPVSEPGIANVLVRLFEAGGDGNPGGGDDVFIATTVTDSDGYYLFDGSLPAGNYFVVVDETTVPDGLTLVYSNSGTETSDPTSELPPDNLTHDFGYDNTDPAAALVGDFVWSDADGDGAQDAGEAGIPGVTIDLVDVSDPFNPVVVATATTDAAGYYSFVVEPDAGGIDYEIRVTDEDNVLFGYTQTGDPDEPGQCFDCDGSGSVTLEPGDVVLTVDFGYQNADLRDISDVVWLDRDHDGIKDAGEDGIEGVTVNLVRGATIVATTTTGPDGSFSFPDLPDGDYTLEISDLGGVLDALLPTTPEAVAESVAVELDGDYVPGASFGNNDDGALEGRIGTTDGFPEPEDENTTVISTVLQSGFAPIFDAEGNPVNNLDFDFGFQGTGTIGDRIWIDTNLNDEYDYLLGELGVNGVLVQLVDNDSGEVVMTTVTMDDANGEPGYYLFEYVWAGDFTVVVADDNFGPDQVLDDDDYDQVFDPDGILDNRTRVELGPNEDYLDADFAYYLVNQLGTGTPGYWKNHPEAWPVDALILGGFTYTRDEAIMILNHPDNGEGKNKEYTLGRALISALLNGYIGNDTTCITDTIAAAQAWFAAHPVDLDGHGAGVNANSGAWKEGEPLYWALDDYNNTGGDCADHR